MTMTRNKLILLAPVAIVGFALFIALGGLVVRELWNWLLPNLFGLHRITFWQALAMLALCRILFGGFAFHGSPDSRMRRRIIERWEAMTPEERERFRQGMHRRWGGGSTAGESGMP